MRFLRFLARIGRFLLYFLLALVFHWEGLIPAVLLLILHFWPGIPIYWCFIALGLWLLFVFIRMLFFRFAISSSQEPTPFRENRNPYSYISNKRRASGKEPGPVHLQNVDTSPSAENPDDFSVPDGNDFSGQRNTLNNIKK